MTNTIITRTRTITQDTVKIETSEAYMVRVHDPVFSLDAWLHG